MSRFKSQVCAGLLAGLLGFAAAGAAFAEAPNADIRNGMQAPPPADQRVALVIGNSNYQTAPKLANPGNDAQSVAQLLNSAGFEVTQATDLSRSEMVRAVQDFSDKVAIRGPGGGHDLLRRPRRAAGGRELFAPGRCEDLFAGRSRRQLAAAGRRDGHAGIHSEPDAHRRARCLPEPSVPRYQRRRTRPCDRRCADGSIVGY